MYSSELSQSSDSLSTNLKQIEETNKMLSNIENKLTNFYQHKASNLEMKKVQKALPPKQLKN